MKLTIFALLVFLVRNAETQTMTKESDLIAGMAKLSSSLKSYIDSEILPRYDAFDKGHRRDHAEYVISQALLLSSHYDVNTDMVYAAAAFHDTGLCEDRKTHHIVSARIIREDSRLAE